MKNDKTEIVIHRVNKIKDLLEIPNNYGCEIDIRSFGDKLILNHEPYQDGELLSNYLDSYNHGLLVLNIRENLTKTLKRVGVEILRGHGRIESHQKVGIRNKNGMDQILSCENIIILSGSYSKTFTLRK